MTGQGRWRSRLAIALYAVAVTSSVIELASGSKSGSFDFHEALDSLPFWVAFLAYATVGTLILVRQPDNRVGWLVGAVGFFPLLSGLPSLYVQRAPDWPLSDAARWFNGWYFVAGLGTVPLLLLLFPDGRPASRLWRWPVIVAGTGLAALLVRYMLGPEGSNCDGGCGDELNPYQLAALRPFLGALDAVGTAGLLVGLLAGAASLVWRFHRARGVERQQVKWLAAATCLALLLVVVPFPRTVEWVEDGVFALMVVLPAAGVGVAVLRYRLYDLGRVVSRTVSYAVLTALLLGVYLVLVTTSTRLLPDGSSLSVAASTLAAAALFQPLRRRVQTVVNRRFNRARYDADRTVAAFSLQLREEVDLDAVRADLLTVVHDTLQPASAGLWLRPGRVSP